VTCLLFLSIWIINGQIPLSIIGYSQDVHYSKLYHSVLSSNAVISSMDLITFAPGCHNDCPKFFTVYDPYGHRVYLKITIGDNTDIVGAFAISSTNSKVIHYPVNSKALWFYGNGTAFLLQDNSTIQTNSYAIYNWMVYTNKTVLVKSQQNTPYSFYRVCLTQDTLYAVDRDKALLIIWPYTSTITTLPLSQNNLWVNSIESLCWSKFDNALYSLHRNGSVYQISTSNGHCTLINPPQWPTLHAISAESQLVIDQNTGDMYYMGFDTSINAYRLIIDTKHAISSTPIQNALYGLQLVGLTPFN